MAIFNSYVKLPEGISWISHRMGPPVDSVQLVYKWLNSMVYGRYNELVTGDYFMVYSL